jgi:hypothetical protein
MVALPLLHNTAEANAFQILYEYLRLCQKEAQCGDNGFINPAYSPGCVNGRSLPFWEGSSAA